MTIPTIVLGAVCLLAALLLTFILPIQRGRLRNQVWDFITLALLVAAGWWINYWDAASNVVVGLIAGGVAILIRDMRLWAARFRGQAYRRSHRYHWYGRAGDWYGRRRRRTYR
jgi:type II secretory pathway component PulF